MLKLIRNQTIYGACMKNYTKITLFVGSGSPLIGVFSNVGTCSVFIRAVSRAGGHFSILFLLVSDHGIKWLSPSLSCCHYGTRDSDGAQPKMRRMRQLITIVTIEKHSKRRALHTSCAQDVDRFRLLGVLALQDVETSFRILNFRPCHFRDQVFEEVGDGPASHDCADL